MCIKLEIEKVEASMTKDTYYDLQQRLQDIYMVSNELQDCKKAEEVLPFLYVEISGNARLSFINRIYGRYRKLLPATDMKILTNWPRHEKPRDNN